MLQKKVVKQVLVSWFLRGLCVGALATFILFSLPVSRPDPRANSGAAVLSQSKTAPLLEPGAVAQDIKLAPYDLQKLFEDTLRACSDKSISCITEKLNFFTAAYGPESSLRLFTLLQEKKIVSPTVDDHQIAHKIGRKTAEIFGVRGKAFLLCSTAFNYGCQHGFFEYALGKTDSARDAARKICGSLESDPSYSSKFKFYCYHGVGHGVMMAMAYDLPKSLATCDSLASSVGVDGCWQGVFMENVNAGMKGEARKGVFQEENPMAPCSVVAEKYRHECFINHAGWLMGIFHNDVKSASASCLKAPKDSISVCLQSIGLMVTNPSWQTSLAPNSEGKPFDETAWKLCRQFPSSYQEDCMTGAVDNILNFDELDLTRASRFCGGADETLKTICYQRIGMDLRAQVTDSAVVVQKCKTFKDAFSKACLAGAGL